MGKAERAHQSEVAMIWFWFFVPMGTSLSLLCPSYGSCQLFLVVWCFSWVSMERATARFD